MTFPDRRRIMLACRSETDSRAAPLPQSARVMRRTGARRTKSFTSGGYRDAGNETLVGTWPGTSFRLGSGNRISVDGTRAGHPGLSLDLRAKSDGGERERKRQADW